MQDALRCAAKAINSGTERKKGNLHPHQYSISAKALNDLGNLLALRATEFEKQRSFEVIVSMIEEESKKVYRTGALVIYDTALRIGARLNLWPNYVYLHAGALTGAQRFLNIKKLDRHIPIPSEFTELGLDGADAEAIFCIYKDCFPGGDSKKCPLDKKSAQARKSVC